MQTTPPCLFYELTGLYCVGCGAGRCLLALLRLDIYAALRFNPLVLLFLPIVLYYFLKIYLAFLLGRDILPVPQFRNRAVGIMILILVLAFGVLRNIPVFPFTLLAPTAV